MLSDVWVYLGVAKRLQEIYPWVLSVKCSCHSAHLTSQEAAKRLPKSCEDVIRNIHAHFSRSPKRTAEPTEFQDYFERPAHQILRPYQTRWLSAVAATGRILEQYEALKSIFE